MAKWLLMFAALLLAASPSAAGPPASRPAVDAPELAHLGPYAVGLRTITAVWRAPAGAPAAKDRTLPIEVWYPARLTPKSKRVTYRFALSGEPPRGLVAFTMPGLAVRGAAPVQSRFPLVVLSHGYSNEPEAMSWLAENLASKGYVVAAIHHQDPDYSDASRRAEPFLRRPLDIAFAVEDLRKRTQAGEPALANADPSRIVLIGYSMGGYGVLTVAGAALEPRGAAAANGPLNAFAAGADANGGQPIPGLKAVIAISPAGMRFNAWGERGLAHLTAPLLVIGGTRDATVGFEDGIVPIFQRATHAPRYFLVFQNAGHALGLGPAPPQAQGQLWDFQWFEDPVWRKDRIIGVSSHFITAFLDRYAKGDESRAAYLDSDIKLGADGIWASGLKGYAAISPGGPGATWKGFNRNTAQGLELRRLPAIP